MNPLFTEWVRSETRRQFFKRGANALGMAALASLGDAQILAPAAAAALAWLLWRRRWMAAAHWLAALVFGLALTALLGAAIDMPRPPTAPSGFGFPSISVTMATIAFGFFAVLIARELPGRNRVWPYLISGIVVTTLGFARLYLGAHWLSDIAGGMLFGVVWLLLLGIAYRRHVARSFLMRPLAGIFYGVFLIAAIWHAPHQPQRLLAQFSPPPPARLLETERWWQAGWAELPTRRDERSKSLAWPLDLQVAGPLEPLRDRLRAAGWREQAQADWVATLGLLDDDTSPLEQPVLPATLEGHAEALLMLRPGADGKHQYALRLWPAPARLGDGTPLWIGTAQVLEYRRPFDVAGLWQPMQDPQAAHAALRDALRGADVREERNPESGGMVLRMRTSE